MNVDDLRGGERHDTWVALQDVKTGRLHFAITVLEENGKVIFLIWFQKTIPVLVSFLFPHQNHVFKFTLPWKTHPLKCNSTGVT